MHFRCTLWHEWWKVLDNEFRYLIVVHIQRFEQGPTSSALQFLRNDQCPTDFPLQAWAYVSATMVIDFFDEIMQLTIFSLQHVISCMAQERIVAFCWAANAHSEKIHPQWLRIFALKSDPVDIPSTRAVCEGSHRKLTTAFKHSAEIVDTWTKMNINKVF